jgi:cyclophilin family peptidyl-prolyl cis-trans isomerase
MKSFWHYSFLSLLILLFCKCKQPAETLDAPGKERKKIEIVTNYGSMIVELYNETPLHRDNMINLANNKAYDSLLFHRVINEFMIQGGDPDSRKAKPNDTLGNGDAPYLVDAEFHDDLFHKKGALAAARDDIPSKASSAMQFYIVQGKKFNDSLLKLVEKRINKNKARDYFSNATSQKTLLDSIQYARDHEHMKTYNILMDSLLILAYQEDTFKPYVIPDDQRQVYKSIGGTPHLDQSYTVFGELVKGMNVLDSIARVSTTTLDRPLTEVRIQSIKLLN